MEPRADAYRLVLCTLPDAAIAGRVANALVEERLAACVNLIPGLQSIYLWEGEIQSDPEVLALIKTTAAGFDALRQRLRALHPYELPEIIAVPLADGDADYLAWIDRVIPRPGPA